MRVRLKCSSGTTDTISGGFAKKLLEAGWYTEDDWINVDGGTWKSCAKVNDIKIGQFNPDGTTCVYYNDEKFHAFCDAWNGDEESAFGLIDESDSIASFTCHCNLADEQICYFIFVSKCCVGILLHSQNDNKIVKTVSLIADDTYGNALEILEGEDGKDSVYIERKYPNHVHKNKKNYDVNKDEGEFTLEKLMERICSTSYDNRINIKANVRFDDGTPALIDFQIPSMLINRIGKYLFVGDRYNEEHIINNNQDVLFIAEDEDSEENYVPSTMPFESIDEEEQNDDEENENGYGSVYILINESFEGLVKIGMTGGSVSNRISQLNSTGTPTPFECYYAAYVDDMVYVEKFLHDHFAEYRVNERREFFKISPKEVHKVLASHAMGDATFS